MLLLKLDQSTKPIHSEKKLLGLDSEANAKCAMKIFLGCCHLHRRGIDAVSDVMMRGFVEL